MKKNLNTDKLQLSGPLYRGLVDVIKTTAHGWIAGDIFKLWHQGPGTPQVPSSVRALSFIQETYIIWREDNIFFSEDQSNQSSTEAHAHQRSPVSTRMPVADCKFLLTKLINWIPITPVQQSSIAMNFSPKKHDVKIYRGALYFSLPPLFSIIMEKLAFVHPFSSRLADWVHDLWKEMKQCFLFILLVQFQITRRPLWKRVIYQESRKLVFLDLMKFSASTPPMEGKGPERPPVQLQKKLLFGMDSMPGLMVGGNHTAARFCTRWISSPATLAGKSPPFLSLARF